MNCPECEDSSCGVCFQHAKATFEYHLENKMKKTQKKQNYLIKVTWPQDAPLPRFRDFKELFEGTGVSLDDKDPVNIAPNLFSITGSANEEARKQASKLPGVKFFANPVIIAASGNQSEKK